MSSHYDAQVSRRLPLVIGHRGAPGYRPEHTRSSYDLALAMGVDAVEPDVVLTRDGVCVVRHENEISGTTNIADLPQYADRRTTKVVDGITLTGWFTEDFTWDELSELRSRERIPKLRPSSASFDDQQGILRLTDVLSLVREASLEQGRQIGVVVEIKHAAYFAQRGLLHTPALLRDFAETGWSHGSRALTIESFEQSALTELQRAGLPATYIYLMEDRGTAADLVGAAGPAAVTYAQQRSLRGLDRLAQEVDGISVDKRVILAPDRFGVSRGPSSIVEDAHARGLRVFTWTARCENAFLLRGFRTGAKAEMGNYEAEWAILRDAGIDGVFVDHADIGVEFFRR